MRIKILGVVTSAIFAMAAIPQTGSAQGLVGLHQKHPVGNKTCFVTHWHNGQSGAWRTKAKARAVALRSWTGLVRLEYGDAWANFKIADQKSMSCTSASNGQTKCAVRAKPCRRR